MANLGQRHGMLMVEPMLDWDDIERDEPVIPERAFPFIVMAIALLQAFGFIGILSAYVH